MPLSNLRFDQSPLRLHQPNRSQLLASDWLADSDSRWRLQGIRGQPSRCHISATRIARGLRFGSPGRYEPRECNWALIGSQATPSGVVLSHLVLPPINSSIQVLSENKNFLGLTLPGGVLQPSLDMLPKPGLKSPSPGSRVRETLFRS